jgi:SAM-dependent methyltransferase
MQFTAQLGAALPGSGWVPAPSYVLRRNAVLHLLRSAAPGRVLEVGCGAGALLYDLHRLGFTGVGVEQSARAAAIATQMLAGTGISVLTELPAETERFDYLMSFEVLEHIEQDTAALRAWATRLRPDGILMLSVPARMKRWSSSDVWAGHFRRYELNDLRAKVSEAGFEIERIVTYGWPVANCIEPVRALVNRRRLRDTADSNRDAESVKRMRTEDSGVARDMETRLYPLYSNVIGRACFQFFGALQRSVFDRDWGTGYLVVGRRRRVSVPS